MRKTKTAILCTLFILAIFTTAAFAGLTPAPVNPDFKEYIKKTADIEQQSSVEKALSYTRTLIRSGRNIRPGGAMPEVFDTSHIRVSRIAPDGKVRDVALPAQFDLRTDGNVTAVRDQDPWGTCWSFAAFGSAESGMLINQEGTKDLSEKYMAYFAYVNESNSKPAFTASVLPPELNPVYDQGGNVTISTALLGRWTGPVNEVSCPYKGTENPSLSAAKVGQLRYVYRLSNKDTEGNVDNSEVKRALMDRGAVYVRFCWADSHYNEETAAYFASAEMSDGGHAVTIVGWDDNFTADNFNENEQPLDDGAWLIKNSWGTEWGESGYFWLSYDDANIGELSQFRIKPGTARNSYHHQYSYDPLGMVNSSGTGDTTMYLAAIFQTDGNIQDNVPELIKAVGFYATAPGLTYRIEIRKGVAAGAPSGGTSAAVVQGTFAYAGYHTIELTQPAEIVKGSKFSVIVRVTGTTAYTDIAPVELYEANFSEAASANAGETFYSTNGTSWVDIYEDDETASLCIKAFSDEIIPLKAENLLPVNNTAGVSLNTLFKTRDFSASNGVTHTATQWQAGICDSFENGIVLDTGDDTENLLDYTAENGVLDYGTTYYWRARFKGSNGAYSDWSDPTSFTTEVRPAGSSGGGCNTGLLALLMISVPALIVVRKRGK